MNEGDTMNWKPLIEKRDAGNGVIEYRTEQDDSTIAVLGQECTILFTVDNTGEMVRQVGRSWKNTRARLRTLAAKIDEDWTTEGIAASIRKILDCEDTEDSPTKHKREVKDAFCDGWDSYRIKIQTAEPECDSSYTKRKYNVKRLGELFSELSEFYWSAGWLIDLDTYLWNWLQDANSPLRPEHREELERLSRETGKWFWWPEDKEYAHDEQEESIDIEEWKILRADKIKEQRDQEEVGE
jgi:hypothetical protein